jgi:hypothetical protein
MNERLRNTLTPQHRLQFKKSRNWFEQGVEWGGISDEQWVDYVKQNFQLNVSL